MMRYVVPLEQLTLGDVQEAGGKAVCLAALARQGVAVPPGYCITVSAFNRFLQEDRLQERIGLELARKRFGEMRWEEVWDSSLRIRNLCLRASIPTSVRQALRDATETLGEMALVVRSSSPQEDSAGASFAGLYTSYVNVMGEHDVLHRVKLVWASLWSHRALTYRHELGHDPNELTMAVLVQVMRLGDRSGVAFGVSPIAESEAVIEGVHGLNQGLVDGSVEADRWTLDRSTGRVLRHQAPQRTHTVVPVRSGVALVELPNECAARAPLSPPDIKAVWNLTRTAEGLFGRPQDVEFTFAGDTLFGLQSRPITTTTQADDPTLKRSQKQTLESLERLHQRIVGELLPSVDAAVDALAQQSATDVSDHTLAARIDERLASQQQYADVYASEFIPFAHGIRLFGEVYNDVMSPEDPFAFLDLLAGIGLEAKQRNDELESLAEQLRADVALHASVREGRWDDVNPDFAEQLEVFMRDHGHMSWLGSRCLTDRAGIAALVCQMAVTAPRPTPTSKRNREQAFLDAVEPGQRDFAQRVLRIGKESYRLRDDDNLHVGRIAGLVDEAAVEGRKRLEARGLSPSLWSTENVSRALRDPGFEPASISSGDVTAEPDRQVRARQLLGQPAGRGVGLGPARVVRQPSDLFEVQQGEVLVCDSIDPNMTFVAPLLAGIVERRGGMLIHGAIIAREYGLPCVTGVPDAAQLIRTGDPVTVDGFLGIVSVGLPLGVQVRTEDAS